MWFIYKHTNLQNKKVYIGITSQSPLKRWGCGNGYQNNELFYKDILKYGWEEGFSHEILATVDTGEEAGKIEDYYIKKYNSTDINFGYNKAEGGFNPGRKGVPHTQETKEKIQQKAKKKSVLCLETNILYNSISEAGRQTGIDFRLISECCNRTRGRKATKNTHWIFSTTTLPQEEREKIIQELENQAYQTQKAYK